MIRRMFTIFGVAALALVEAAVFATFPGPVPLIHFSLIVIVNLVTSFRVGTAWASAFAAGLMLDVIMPWPAGCGTLAMLMTVALSVPLSTRVLTHVSVASVVGLNAAVFIVFQAVAALYRASADLVAGQGFRIWPVAGFVPLLSALAIQLSLCVVWQVFARRAHRAIVSSFLILR